MSIKIYKQGSDMMRLVQILNECKKCPFHDSVDCNQTDCQFRGVKIGLEKKIKATEAKS
jgi:hypothetical protein